MILIRNRLIIGMIRRIVKLIFSVIYKILELFNLHFTLFVSLIGVVLFLTGVLSTNGTVAVIFYLALSFSIVYAVFATVKKLLGFQNQKPKKRGMQIVKTDQTVGAGQVERVAQPISQAQQSVAYSQPVQNQTTVQTVVNDQPKYFNVKGRPDYVMAEYLDRYELYHLENGRAVKVRTDFK